MPTCGIICVSSVQCSLMIADSGPGRAEAHQLVERALARDAEDLGAEVGLAPAPGAGAGSRPAPRSRASVDQPVALLLQQDLHPDDVEDAALVLQRRDGDLPAAVQLAEQVLARDAHVLEEDLVEVGVAGHLPQRPHLDARDCACRPAGTRCPWRASSRDRSGRAPCTSRRGGRASSTPSGRSRGSDRRRAPPACAATPGPSRRRARRSRSTRGRRADRMRGRKRRFCSSVP